MGSNFPSYLLLLSMSPVGSVYMLLLLLLFRLLDHSVVLFCILSCDSSSIGHNVSLLSVCPQRVYGSVMLLIVYDCCCCCCSL